MNAALQADLGGAEPGIDEVRRHAERLHGALEDRSENLARAAPGGPEVDEVCFGPWR